MTYPPQQPGPQQPGQPGQPYPEQPGQYPPPGYPAAGAPVAPPAKKGKGKIVLLVILGVLVLCCGGGVIMFAVSAGKSDSSSNSSTSGSGSNSGSGATKAKIGEAARDGKFEFVVQKVECGKTQVGDQYLNKTAQGQFCLVTVQVKNIGDKPQMFSGSNQKAFNGKTTYNNSGEAEVYANKDTQTFLNDINPGNQVTGTLVFDIPKDAKITTLELHDSPFSGGVTVNVG
jgi:hypothetical protein